MSILRIQSHINRILLILLRGLRAINHPHFFQIGLEFGRIQYLWYQICQILVDHIAFVGKFQVVCRLKLVFTHYLTITMVNSNHVLADDVLLHAVQQLFVHFVGIAFSQVDKEYILFFWAHQLVNIQKPTTVVYPSFRPEKLRLFLYVICFLFCFVELVDLFYLSKRPDKRQVGYSLH